ncbi:MAG: sulfatase-like hydrolase/transferase [Candidatus Hydrogenedentes bacterium]|nr:sulfatase-like hydrolase/transferase [Candidatus Hydrogenedentota bacterium]
MNRRGFLQAAASGAAALAASCATRRHGSAPPPNILLIVSDDQGYNDLGCYGNDTIITPCLDRLAAEGVRLTDFYVTWCACTPSRGSLLTGRYPQRNGTYDMYRNDKPDYGYKYGPEEYAVSPERILGMDTREVLLPQVLDPAGYASGIFGKWDLGQLRRFLPLQRGFDDFYGYVNTGIDYYTHERYGVPSMYRNNQPTTEDRGTYTTDLFKREALRFIRGREGRPFFCYLPFNAPHIASVLERPRPVQAPEEYKQMYPKAAADAEQRRIDHMASLTAMDDAIAEVLDLIDASGQRENTIVIFFSDNGGSGTADNTPLRGRKGQVFEGGIRVPCIIRWPGVVPPGTVCTEFLSSLDLFPTLCAATGARPSPDIPLDGFDIAPVLAGREPSPRTEMFWKRRGDCAARVGNWKWVDSAKGSGLFDLASDIGEEHDLSAERPEQLARVKARYDAWIDAMENAEPRGPFRDY